jgi:integrase
MRKIKLTEANVRSFALAASENDVFISDTEARGLKLRLRRGKNDETLRAYYHQFSRIGHKNKSPKSRLDDVGGITLADARQIVRERNGQLARNEDPIQQKADAKIKQAQTVESLLPRFMNFKRSHLRKRSIVEMTRHLFIYARPLHALPIEKVTRREVAVLKAGVAEAIAQSRRGRAGKVSGWATSDRMGSSLSGFFVWCMQQGLIETNPASFTTTAKETPRSRVLTPDELRLIWINLEEGSDYCAIIKLLMLLGSRASEIAQLRWDEVRGDTIELPAERVKNGRPHTITLPLLACDIVERLPRRVNWDGSPRAHVFGTRSASAGFNAWGWEKQQLDQRIAGSTGQALASWVVHDLRRSFSTHLNEHNICAPHVTEALLGHVGYQSTVAPTYNRASYQSERRRAVTLWSEMLAAWIEGKTSNVMPLQRPA